MLSALAHLPIAFAPPSKEILRSGPPQLAYLGVGYDIVGGDPHASLIDPGWRSDIFDRDWVTAQSTQRQVQQCTYDSQTGTISGGKSAQSTYEKEWKTTSSIDFPFFAKVSFTTSDDVKMMNKSAWTNKDHFVDARATCQINYASLPPPFLPYNLSTYFVAAVESLPTKISTTSDDTISGVMKYFGTHYTNVQTMGGQMVLRYKLSASSYSSLKEKSHEHGFSIDAGAQGSFWKWASPKGGYEQHINTAATNAFENATSNEGFSSLYIGGAKFQDNTDGTGNAAAWAAGFDTPDKLSPVSSVQNELIPWAELLKDPSNFPTMSPSDLTAKYAVVKDFISRLCTPGGPDLGHPECTDFPVDPLIIPDCTIPTGSAVTALAWARDGGNVTTSDADGYLRDWNVITHEAWRTTKAHDKGVNDVQYSPNSTRLATASSDGTVKVWDVATAKSTLTLVTTHGRVTTVAWSPDGKQIASSGVDDIVAVWDLATGKVVSRLCYSDPNDSPDHCPYSGWVYTVAYSPDGKSIAASGDAFGIRIWDVATWKCTLTLPSPPQSMLGAAFQVSWSPDGKHLASGNQDKTAKIWDATTGRYTQSLPMDGLTWSVAYSPDGTKLAAGSGNAPNFPGETNVKVWDTDTGKCLQTFTGHTASVHALAFSMDNSHLASGGDDKAVIIDNLASAAALPAVDHVTKVPAVNVTKVQAKYCEDLCMSDKDCGGGCTTCGGSVLLGYKCVRPPAPPAVNVTKVQGYCGELCKSDSDCDAPCGKCEGDPATGYACQAWA